MKKIKRILALLLIMILCIGMRAIPVFAASSSQDGLEVTLTTDKELYSQGKPIVATLTVMNKNKVAVSNVSLENMIPKGYKLVDGSKATKQVESLSAGETVTLTVTYIVDGSNSSDIGSDNSNNNSGSETGSTTGYNDRNNNSNTSNSSRSNDTIDFRNRSDGSNFNTTSNRNTSSQNIRKLSTSSPKTGNDFNVVFWVILLVLSIIGIVTFIVYNKKKGKKMLSLFLCVAMFGTLISLSSIYVYATAQQRSISVSHSINVGLNKVVLNALVVYDSVDSNISELDADGDGIPDCIQNQDMVTDTDGDGLTDYEELVYTNTNPILVDTDGNGTSDADEDLDVDSLTTKQELEIGTNPVWVDTDNDGLDDGEELVYNTDPLKKDTDGDGALDGWEIANSYDPLVYNERFSVTTGIKSSDFYVSAELNTTGEQVDTLKIKEVTNNVLMAESIPGYIGAAYDFSFDGTFESATISFMFDENLLHDDTFDPVIYFYNEDDQILEEMETTIEGNIASTVVSHFSTYILLNKTDYDKVWDQEIKPPTDNDSEGTLDVVFVIDYSASMDDNDPNMLCKTLSKEFVAKLRDNIDRAGLVKFIATSTVASELTYDKDTLYSAIDGISYDRGYNSNSGTNGSAGIYDALQLLVGSSASYKYIIFLTDGDDNRTSYAYSDLTALANNNNITIYSIGLGSANKSTLTSLAEGTNGKYYQATTDSNVEDILNLDEIYEKIKNETIDYSTDSNNDGISDYFTKLMCEGVLRTGTGVQLFEGYGYDEVQSNDDFDGDGLKNGEEVKVIIQNEKIYLKAVSSPALNDSDNDGISDREDDAPLKKGYADGIIGELAIISNQNDSSDSGHAWLTYKSYVDDTLDVSGLQTGYLYNYEINEFYAEKVSTYKINRDGYMNIGNAGTEGQSAAFSTLSGSCGGILYNREFRGQWQESPTHSKYSGAVAYTRKITQEQLDAVLQYCSKNNYYNLYSHNCSSVALEAWECAYGNEDGLYNRYQSGFHLIYSNFDNPEALKESILKKTGVDINYHNTMLEIIENWR